MTSRKDSSQSPSGLYGRPSGSRNGVEVGQLPLGGGTNYDQRRTWMHNDYGNNTGTGTKPPSQSNGDYAYYSTYGMGNSYGGWTGGNSGFYHHYHPPGISSPVGNAYMDSMTLFGNNGSVPTPTDHPGFYNYFPSSNIGDYNTWGGPNFVASARSGGSTKPAEFYHHPAAVNNYSGSGVGYGREYSDGGPHSLDQDMSRMGIYDGGSTNRVGESGLSSNGGTHSRYSQGVGGGETKKKSWATIASRPAKPPSSTGMISLGRGRGRGVPIGGVPGSTRSIGISPGSTMGQESGGLWTSPSPQPPTLQTTYPQPGSNIIPASYGNGQERKSPQAGELARDSIGGSVGQLALNVPDRDGTKVLDYSYSSSNSDLPIYPKRREPDGTEANDIHGVFPKEKPKELAKCKPSDYTQSPSGGGGGGVYAISTTKRSIADYNPKEFTLPLKGARYFVIKSYSEDDVHRSIKYDIWCSTEHGNKRLDAAYKEREGKGPVYLFYSVNASGHFCGVAKMMSPLDYETDSNVWAQDKWKGQFSVKWIYVKDVPNQQLRHIRLENNENKPVTNSRDTQEVPAQKGKEVLRIIHEYRHTTSLFDDYAHYERRQEEEKAQKKKYGNYDDRSK